jgi:hypothetical protein
MLRLESSLKILLHDMGLAQAVDKQGQKMVFQDLEITTLKDILLKIQRQEVF